MTHLTPLANRREGRCCMVRRRARSASLWYDKHQGSPASASLSALCHSEFQLLTYKIWMEISWSKMWSQCGRWLHWLQKTKGLYLSLWENDPTFHIIYYFSQQFPQSLQSHSQVSSLPQYRFPSLKRVANMEGDLTSCKKGLYISLLKKNKNKKQNYTTCHLIY